jgi:hypothetical protein
VGSWLKHVALLRSRHPDSLALQVWRVLHAALQLCMCWKGCKRMCVCGGGGR